MLESTRMPQSFGRTGRVNLSAPGLQFSGKNLFQGPIHSLHGLRRVAGLTMRAKLLLIHYHLERVAHVVIQLVYCRLQFAFIAPAEDLMDHTFNNSHHNAQ